MRRPDWNYPVNTISLVAFLCIVGVGSYLQAFTGFAIGIFVLGAVVMFQLVSLETTATVINIMTVLNTAVALHGSWHLIDRKLLVRTLMGVLPGVPLGLGLLAFLSTRNAQLLQIILGIVVLIAGVTLYIRPRLRDTRSPSISFVAAGALGGVLGGLFSIPGPPIIYHFYVQPMTMQQVRLTLIGIFGAVSLLRLLLLFAFDSVESDALYLGLVSLPMVALTTALFVKYPPALSELSVRRAAFVLLSAMGIGIFAMAWR